LSRLSRLYVITDNKYIDYNNIKNSLEILFENGVKILQFRDKILDDIQYKQIAIKIQSLCKQYKVLFIINDRYKIAIDIQSDGIHLGYEDITNKDFINLRKNYNGIIGISCYSDITRAKEFEKLKADYVAFGSAFISSSKPNAKRMSLDIIKLAKKELHIPICIIGGINEKNISQITQYNPNMIAIISDIWESENIILKIKTLNSLINNN
jgi:thiamine-phosphate pyrophosphorylase